MALNNKAANSIKPIASENNKIPNYKHLNGFVKSVKNNRPYAALFYLLKAFWELEDERLIRKEKDYIADAIYDLGAAIELQIKQLQPEKIPHTDFSFVDGVQYGKLLLDFEELKEMVEVFESSSIFGKIVEINRELRPYKVELPLVVDAINQLSETVKDFSIDISRMVDYFIHHEIDYIYESNVQSIKDLLVYFDMLDNIWMCLNGIEINLRNCSNEEELNHEIQYMLEGLLEHDLEDLFERKVDINAEFN